MFVMDRTLLQKKENVALTLRLIDIPLEKIYHVLLLAH